MIIRNARSARTSEPAAFAWSGLRKFQNVEFVTREIIKAQNVHERWHNNVRKQAQQLRYCLIQAREYFNAAQSVSLATKPNLLYYGTMSLALAEILFKQTGDSSLDRARAEHKHHGLTMSVGAIPAGAPSLQAAATQLRAEPVEIRGQRRGTFELWHRTAREHPLAGIVETAQPGGVTSTSRYQSILSPIDVRYPIYPTKGLTLLDCILANPLMTDHVGLEGLTSPFVRGSIAMSGNSGPHWKSTITLTFHPSKVANEMFERILVNPGMVDRINFIGTSANEGMHVQLLADHVNGHTNFPLPPASTIDTEEWLAWTNEPCLNEFGYLYVGLYLAGNYARYFPDKWLHDVEQSAPLSLAIEELCSVAEWRAPWLCLCELSRTMIVNEA